MDLSVFQCWEPGEGNGIGSAETIEEALELIAQEKEAAGPDSTYGYEVFDWDTDETIFTDWPEPDTSHGIERAERAWDTYAYGN